MLKDFLKGMVALIVACILCPGMVCDLCAQDFLNLDTRVTVLPAEQINTKHLEYAPTYYGSGIVFVHAKEDNQGIDRRIGMPFFELMYSELGPDGMPGRAHNFSPNIRTRFHEGPATFSSDLKTIYFTRTNMANGQNVVGPDGRTTMKIYLADKGPDDWINIRELPFCSDSFSVMSPALSPDNMRLIFMSDKPGGHGGWDLYISDKYSGVWSEPVNLGPTINTPGNEALPFWHPRGVLFFSSDGHPGHGRLDIFAALLHEDGSFSAPLNLGPKFNTRHDDLTFICDREGLTGFFASSRKEGLGKDDLYFFRAEESLFQPWLTVPPVLVEMMLSIRDDQSLQAVPGITASLSPVTGHQDSVDMTEQITTGPEFISDINGIIPVQLDPGKDYLVVLRGTGYQTREVLLSSAAIHAGSIYYLDLERSDKSGVTAPHDQNCIPTGAMVIASSTYRPVTNVLVQVRNTCDGTNIVTDTDTNGRFRTCLQPGCEYEVSLIKAGFLEERYICKPGLNVEEKIIYLTEEDLTERSGKEPTPGDVLVLNHIYYDFNKSAIRTGDARELSALAAMMQKYPSMTIELESHTDSRGTEDYNLELSELRGISARDFLVSRGIAPERIKLKPMGESRLRNHCADNVPCTEAEHQINRRTEIRILTIAPNLEIKYSDQQE